MSPQRNTANFWIKELRLSPHPEGGYFRETYASERILRSGCLSAEFAGERPASTAIYFLLEAGNFSAFHRLRSDEMWHFYTGDAVEVLIINADGSLDTMRLGPMPDDGEVFQAVVPAGKWFGSRLAVGGEFALVGCTVSPGFHFDDFELGTREELTSLYPQQSAVIRQLTRS